jgi:hypothetical protein
MGVIELLSQLAILTMELAVESFFPDCKVSEGHGPVEADPATREMLCQVAGNCRAGDNSSQPRHRAGRDY